MSLLLDPEGGDPEALAHAAELAQWPLPRVLAVLAVDSDSAGPIVRRLDLDALVGSEAGGAVLVLPDPDGPGRAAALRRALGAVPAAAVLGPTVPPREAHRSLRWARIALELVRRDALPSARPTRVADHLATVVLLQDPGMARALVAQHLSVLDGLPKAERERLLETLGAWLAHQRHTPRIASELHVHPQTVRYRIGKLRELLGATIDTPDGRFELERALRARGALAP